MHVKFSGEVVQWRERERGPAEEHIMYSASFYIYYDVQYILLTKLSVKTSSAAFQK